MFFFKLLKLVPWYTTVITTVWVLTQKQTLSRSRPLNAMLHLDIEAKITSPKMDKYSINVKLKRKQDQPLSYKLTVFPFKLTILKNMYWFLIFLTAIGYYIEHIVLKISEMPWMHENSKYWLLLRSTTTYENKSRTNSCCCWKCIKYLKPLLKEYFIVSVLKPTPQRLLGEGQDLEKEERKQHTLSINYVLGTVQKCFYLHFY